MGQTGQPRFSFVLKRENISGPMVYAFKSNGVVIYVGSTVNGLSRPLSPQHNHRAGIKHLYDEVEVHIFDDLKSARQFEVTLIKEHLPILNERHNAKRHESYKSEDWKAVRQWETKRVPVEWTDLEIEEIL